jgi:hypothetical protein
MQSLQGWRRANETAKQRRLVDQKDSLPERGRWRGKKSLVDAIAEFPSTDLPDGSEKRRACADPVPCRTTQVHGMISFSSARTRTPQ